MPAYAHRMDGITGSAIRDAVQAAFKGPTLISFGGGNPSSSSFPVEQVKEITDYLLNEKRSRCCNTAQRKATRRCAAP